MPFTRVLFYQEADGSVPIVAWLDRLAPRVQDKCLARLGRLEQLGHELGRPEADLLREGMYELRVGYQGVHYRMLYFFHGRGVAVISHGLTKERTVPAVEIERAIRNRRAFDANPSRHTFTPETS